jgi:hypothetical protein
MPRDGFVQLPGENTAVYPVDLAGRRGSLALKIYGDDPPWIVAKEALVAECLASDRRVSCPHSLSFRANALSAGRDRAQIGGPADLLCDLDELSRQPQLPAIFAAPADGMALATDECRDVRQRLEVKPRKCERR